MVSYFRRTRSVMFSCQKFQSRYFSEVHGPAAFEATLKFMCLVWENQWQVLKTEVSNWIVLDIFSEFRSVFSSKKLSVYLQKSPELIMAHLWIFFHFLSWYIYCISLITTLWIFLWQRYVKYKLFTAEVMLRYNFILFASSLISLIFFFYDQLSWDLWNIGLAMVLPLHFLQFYCWLLSLSLSKMFVLYKTNTP